MGDDSSSTGPLEMIIGVGAICAGAYKGFCDAQGIPIEKENLETILLYGGTAAYGSLGALIGLVGGPIAGGMIATRKKARGALAGAILGPALGGAICAGVGAIYTLIGYGGGYVVGHLLKN